MAGGSRYGGAATLGTTTIEYEDAGSALGFGPGEDLESHFVNKIGSRVHSYHPRNHQLGSSRINKTIDENVLLNKIVVGTRNMLRNEGVETMEDRMRVFEDEIIKRIKIIQSFVKNMDGRVNRMQANQKQMEQQQSVRKHQTTSMLEESNNDDRRPERLRDVMEDQAPIGASQQQQIKEAIKWELEIVERKSEERFKEMEGLIKKIGVKIDQNSSSIVEETQSEFQNIKLQFEEFGNTIYERISSEVQEKIAFELSKSLTVLQDSLNNDFSQLLGEQTKPLEVSLLTLQSQCEELRQSQELALEELNKYQDNIENIIEQNQSQLRVRVESIGDDMEKVKDTIAKDKRTIEFRISELVKEQDF